MPPATITEYANYIIYFSDPAEYNFAVGLNGTTSVQMSPKTAADMFGFVDGVNYNTGGPLNPDKGMYGLPPYGLPTVPPGYEINYPAPSGVFLTWDVDEVTVAAQPGSPASIFPPGPGLILKWNASILMQPANITPDDPLIAPMPLRRWIQGFEWNGQAETQGSATKYTRDASRTLDGVGYALRSNTNSTITHTLNESTTPADAHKSWERFYLRVRQNDALNIDIWRTKGSPSPNNGGLLRLPGDGSINIYNVNSSGTETLLGNTGPILTTNLWYKIDCVVIYSSGSGGSLRVFVNGALVFDSGTIAPVSGGLGSTGTHTQTVLGTQTVTANNWELDFDDWHNAEIPAITGVESLNSVDFVLGTHVRSSKVDDSVISGWTGQEQSMNQMMQPTNIPTTSQFTSSTSSASLEGITDADDTSDPIGTVICAAAALATTYGNVASGSAAGQLGYRLAGGSAVLEPTVEQVSPRYNTTLWPGTGINIVNPTIVPASAIYVKAANAVLTTLKGLGLLVQYVGMWGFEDGSDSDFPRLYLTHNALWPNIEQAFLGPTPGPALVAVQSGTYTGNGTVQTIQIPLPCHILWIRAVGLTDPGVKLTGAMLASHPGGNGADRPDLIPRVDFDPDTGITTFTVVGNANGNNVSSQLYQYIAICDPAFQFVLCGAYMHGSSVASASNPFIDPNFTPACMFIHFDRSDNDGSVRMAFKGPGHAGTTGNLINGTALSNFGSFAAGAFTSGLDVQQSGGNQAAYTAIKTTDDCSQSMFQIFTYTGDGNSSRVITFPNVTTRYGVLIVVQPHNAQAIARDPSDAGASSHSFATNAAVANGITAVGVDQFTVGSTLNANGIVYDVFVVLGDTAGMNNGTYFPQPCTPTDLVPTAPPIGLNIFPLGGLILGGTTRQTQLKDVSGIYTLVKGKLNDTLYDRQTGQSSVDVAIPNPRWKTGYIGG